MLCDSPTSRFLSGNISTQFFLSRCKFQFYLLTPEINTEEENHSDIHCKGESDLTKRELNLCKNGPRMTLKCLGFLCLY